MKRIKETWIADKATAGTREAFWTSSLGRIKRKLYKPDWKIVKGKVVDCMRFDRYVIEDETD